jgi:16S rRNA pseudouridine516 synthase
MRLDRCLANAGLGSRTEVRDLVKKGRVTVCGQVVRDPGYRVQPDQTDAVYVNGQSILVRHQIHLMLHKPAGLVTALDDKHLPTIASLVPQQLWRRGLFPVGRLDRDTTGLLILTTDGTLGHRLASPNWEVWKKYELTVEGAAFTAADPERFAHGLILPDGLQCQPARLEILDSHKASLTLHEGKYHQVKRMMLATGRTVTRLHRHSVGSLVLDPALLPGQWRELTGEEIDTLYRLVDLSPDKGS